MYTSTEAKQTAQYETLNSYMSDQLSLDDALDSFCGDVEAKYRESSTPEDVEGLLWDCWRAVVIVASATPSSSEKGSQQLVDFVLAIPKRLWPSKDGSECVVQESKLWSELPFFGMQMREAWNLVASDDSIDEHKVRWLNLNAWTATLVATVCANNQTTPDFSLYGIWTIRTALEESQKKDTSAIALQAAAMWFTHAASALYQMSLESKTFDGKLAKPGDGFENCEWRGYSQHRWAAWSRRLDALGQAGAGGEGNDVVAEALAAMKAADGADYGRRR